MSINNENKITELAVAQTDIHRDIIEQSKKGDSAAQYRLYKLYAKAMFNIAYRMMNTREEAEDILQDSFSDAFARLKSFRYESSFGSWFKRIVINNCLNEIKRRKADLKFCDNIGVFEHKINFEFSNTKYYIIARTQLKQDQNAFWAEVSDLANTIFSGNNKTQIYHFIFMPASITVTFENKFGNIYSTDHNGKITVKLSNGDFKANNLSGDVNLDFSF